ncbi:MAG: F0F1 ATP synthase subunit B [Clostridia bacterium]
MEVKLYQGLLEINWNLLFSAITVLVLYLILKHFFFEKVHKFMEARKAAVQDNLDRAKATEEEAQALLSEYQATLSNAEEEKRAIIKEAKAEADRRADAIVGEAKIQAQRIVSEAHENMRAEEEKAVVQLKKEVSSLAVLAAERIMQRELDEKSQQALVDQVLEEAAREKWQNQ